MSKVAIDTQINNVNWTSLKKNWKRLKIIRSQARNTKNKEIEKILKDEEIEISLTIRQLSDTVTDGKGNKITVPVFPILGGNQDGK